MKDEYDLLYVVGSFKDIFKYIIGVIFIDYLYNFFKVNYVYFIENEVKFNILINFI